MKIVHYINRFRIPAGVLSLIALMQMTACVTKNEFLTSTVTPAARGYVKVKQDDNQNYAIQLHIDYLAEVERLQPARQTYVVWLVTKDDVSKNIGQLQSDSKSLSNNLKADFETVSSFEPTRIYITAEMDGTIAYPDHEIILDSGLIKI